MGIVIDLKERKIMSLSPLPPPASPVSSLQLVMACRKQQFCCHTIRLPTGYVKFNGKLWILRNSVSGFGIIMESECENAMDRRRK